MCLLSGANMNCRRASCQYRVLIVLFVVMACAHGPPSSRLWRVMPRASMP
ncbi:MAG: hypothetical protein ACLSVD_12080 [Eggerthellaceae bacterium]